MTRWTFVVAFLVSSFPVLAQNSGSTAPTVIKAGVLIDEVWLTSRFSRTSRFVMNDGKVLQDDLAQDDLATKK